jgi:rRNA maturation endonuclease Nob1
MKRRAEGKDIPEMRKAGGIVRLLKASLCVNCEHISEAEGERCPRCGSPSLLSLARILNRQAQA